MKLNRTRRSLKTTNFRKHIYEFVCRRNYEDVFKIVKRNKDTIVSPSLVDNVRTTIYTE